MSAREELEILLLDTHPVTRGLAIDAFKAEIQREDAATVRKDAEQAEGLPEVQAGMYHAAGLIDPDKK